MNVHRVINHFKHHKNPLAYYWYKYVSKADAFTFRLKNNMQLTVPTRMMHTYKECFFDESYTRNLPSSIQNSLNVVIDIGANVGYFSLSMFSFNPKARVFSFEPMKRNFQLLEEYRRANNNFQLTAFNQGVGKEMGTLTLYHDASDEFTTSATLFSDSDQPDKQEVPVVTLKYILEEQNIDGVDLLKVDCEGAEYDILYNTSFEDFEKIRSIAIETHPGPNEGESAKALVDFLQDKNYQTHREGDLIWAWKKE
jgi:FkbM family methyltransferase